MDNSKYCLISRQIHEDGKQIIKGFKDMQEDETFSGWIFISTDNENLEEYDLVEFERVRLSMMIMQNHGIRNFLDGNIGTRLLYDEETEEYTNFYEAPKKNIRQNEKFKSDIEANISFSFTDWVKSSSLNALSTLGLGTAIGLMYPLSPNVMFPFVSGGLIFAGIASWRKRASILKKGKACAGFVISLNPLKIAIATDLSKSDKKYFPIIKVISPVIKTDDLKVGDKIGAVATFSNLNDQLPHWHMFFPVTLNEIKKSKQQQKDFLEEHFTTADWDNIYEQIIQLGRNIQLGTYKVDKHNNDWRNSDFELDKHSHRQPLRP